VADNHIPQPLDADWGVSGKYEDMIGVNEAFSRLKESPVLGETLRLTLKADRAVEPGSMS